ncbi:S-layer homology domain-containing protein [Pseudobacillus badius]|uniref:S-layer homology domain-containing protein n=1 Tax=Bacillus badius TaxID=1455 RepID=UPI001CBF15A5|nr:S-layer homology domain-containing protein [Bacillus badius]UAT29010.1 S-layer homology domain-containing protein [Bacillus badius]GLY12573.1 hypothetical protein Bbad01_37890 [Bacillus badius]
MKKIIVLFTTLLLLVLSFGEESKASSFHDVDKEYQFYRDVQFWASKGVIKGYSDNTFRPLNTVSRGEAAIILSRALELPLKGRSQFKDIASPETDRYVEAGRKAGFISGYTPELFRPNEKVTRAQMAIYLYKALKLNPAAYKDLKFLDVGSRMTAYKEIRAVASRKIIVGFPDGTFKPNGEVTRGEFASFLTNSFYPYVQQEK